MASADIICTSSMNNMKTLRGWVSYALFIDPDLVWYGARHRTIPDSWARQGRVDVIPEFQNRCHPCCAPPTLPQSSAIPGVSLHPSSSGHLFLPHPGCCYLDSVRMSRAQSSLWQRFLGHPCWSSLSWVRRVACSLGFSSGPGTLWRRARCYEVFIRGAYSWCISLASCYSILNHGVEFIVHSTTKSQSVMHLSLWNIHRLSDLGVYLSLPVT